MTAAYTIRKRFAFSAAHYLTNLPDDHQCARLHGHNYVVTVELRGPHLNAQGFLRDYGDLRLMREYLDNHLDHRCLNDVLDFNPTAEHLAVHLFHMAKTSWPELSAVSVEETPTTWAEYRP